SFVATFLSLFFLKVIMCLRQVH
ncbi:methyltransferase domain protein, partial [Vibrio parahaemolyticus V-223/04]